MTHHLYAPMNRPAEEAAPAGYAIHSDEVTDFTPYGVIAYDTPLTPLDCWKYELRNLFEDYKVGDDVEWIEHGETKRSQIVAVQSKWKIWVDDYTWLPFWKLHIAPKIRKDHFGDFCPEIVPTSEPLPFDGPVQDEPDPFKPNGVSGPESHADIRPDPAGRDFHASCPRPGAR